MAGILEQIGATSTGMQLLLICWLLSGQLLLVAFLVPPVGKAMTATLLILTAMTFMGSGLVYLSLLPFDPEASPS